MKKILFSALALVLLAGAGCKKDKDEETCDLNSTSLIGNYKVTAATAQMGTSPEIDAMGTFYEPCELDDITSFAANGVLTYSDQGTVCGTSGNETGTWNLVGSILSSTLDVAGTISSFNCNSFVVTSTDTGFTYRVTYTRQ